MLSDERIDLLFNEHRGDGGPTALCEQFARAIESAACADRDARIAELERELAEARKALKDLIPLAEFGASEQSPPFADDALLVAARDAINAYYLEPHVKQAHEALRAAMKGQQ